MEFHLFLQAIHKLLLVCIDIDLLENIQDELTPYIFQYLFQCAIAHVKMKYPK